MIKLSHSTRCSNPSVSPANWKTGGKTLLNKNWQIQYRFYDDMHAAAYPNGKLVKIQGMNKFSTLEERRKYVELRLERIMQDLVEKQYNPITKKSVQPLTGGEDANQYMPLIEALNYARKNIKGSDTTLRDLKDTIAAITPPAEASNIADLPVMYITRKHLSQVLDKAAEKKDGTFSGHKYNKLRTYLKILFEYLLDKEIIEANPVASIKKQKKGIVKRIRTVITEEEAKRASDYFKERHRPFYLFMNIFYHSGGRKTELLDVKYEDVDLVRQRFKIVVKKGQVYTEHYVVIKDVALPYWLEAMIKAGPGDYIFGKNPVRNRMGLIASKEKLEADRIRKIWGRHAKEKLGIEADFYTLKHLHTSKVAETFDKYTAAKVNRHGVDMVDKHYDTRRKAREENIIKGMAGELGE